MVQIGGQVAVGFMVTVLQGVVARVAVASLHTSARSTASPQWGVTAAAAASLSSSSSCPPHPQIPDCAGSASSMQVAWVVRAPAAVAH